jgi:hypothetical protein
MAASRWLEKSYVMDKNSEYLDATHLSKGPSSKNAPSRPVFIEDFDTDTSFSADIEFAENEFNLLRGIFEHLRAG